MTVHRSSRTHGPGTGERGRERSARTQAQSVRKKWNVFVNQSSNVDLRRQDHRSLQAHPLRFQRHTGLGACPLPCISTRMLSVPSGRQHRLVGSNARKGQTNSPGRQDDPACVRSLFDEHVNIDVHHLSALFRSREHHLALSRNRPVIRVNRIGQTTVPRAASNGCTRGQWSRSGRFVDFCGAIAWPVDAETQRRVAGNPTIG